MGSTWVRYRNKKGQFARKGSTRRTERANRYGTTNLSKRSSIKGYKPKTRKVTPRLRRMRKKKRK